MHSVYYVKLYENIGCILINLINFTISISIGYIYINNISPLNAYCMPNISAFYAPNLQYLPIRYFF